MIKKICYSCGRRVERLYEGLCDECYKKIYPPLKEIKKINLKYCNFCKRIKYNNRFYSIDEFVRILPEIVKKRVVIDDKYSLNNIEICDLEVKNGSLDFNLVIDCELK